MLPRGRSECQQEFSRTALSNPKVQLSLDYKTALKERIGLPFATNCCRWTVSIVHDNIVIEGKDFVLYLREGLDKGITYMGGVDKNMVTQSAH